jgi:hypothetical protein
MIFSYAELNSEELITVFCFGAYITTSAADKVYLVQTISQHRGSLDSFRQLIAYLLG